MSKEIVETIYGKHSTFEVIKQTSTFSSPTYQVRCSDGSYSGTFSTLSAAVAWAQKEATKR